MAVVESTSPGGDTQLQGYLRRKPLNVEKCLLPATPQESLARKLMQFVSVKGEDLLLQAETENQVKFHRLRSSVPSQLWKWRTICGVGLETPRFPHKRIGTPSHFDFLTMEVVTKEASSVPAVAFNRLARQFACPDKRKKQQQKTAAHSLQDQCPAPGVRRASPVGLRVHKAESSRSTQSTAGEPQMGKKKSFRRGTHQGTAH